MFQIFELNLASRLFTLRERGWQTTRGKELITATGVLFITADERVVFVR